MTVTGCSPTVRLCQLHMQQPVLDIVVGLVVVAGLLSAAHHGYRYVRGKMDMDTEE